MPQFQFIDEAPLLTDLQLERTNVYYDEATNRVALAQGHYTEAELIDSALDVVRMMRDRIVEHRVQDGEGLHRASFSTSPTDLRAARAEELERVEQADVFTPLPRNEATSKPITLKLVDTIKGDDMLPTCRRRWVLRDSGARKSAEQQMEAEDLFSSMPPGTTSDGYFINNVEAEQQRGQTVEIGVFRHFEGAFLREVELSRAR